MTGQTYVTFREVQQLRKTWLVVLLVLSCLLVIGFFGYGMVQQLIFGRPFGDEPMSDAMLAIVGTLVIVGSIGFLAYIYWGTLETEVRRDGLYIRFFPWERSFRRIPLERVAKYTVARCMPLLQYGGLRVSRKARMYVMSSTRGVRLEFPDRRYIFIGSQRAEEFARAIGSIFPHQTCSVR